MSTEHTVGFGWTAEALAVEIERLELLIDGERPCRDLRARCTRAYLTQMLRDRRSLLKQLRHQARAARHHGRAAAY